MRHEKGMIAVDQGLFFLVYQLCFYY